MRYLLQYLMNIKKGLINVLKGLDCLVNAFCFGDGGEYISSRIGKRRDDLERFFAMIVDKIFFWQKEHTKNSIQPDKGKDALL